MDGREFCRGSLVLLMAILATGCAATPGPAPTTVWDTLGVTGGLTALGSSINKSGNVPGLEPKPPLKLIAAAENLKSAIPAIKKAAEVKQAEDAAPQKIKAVKYLAKMGCGCYDEDGSISEALVAAMDDCTEEVRYQTVKALYKQAERVQGGECPACNGSCCNQDLVDKLWKLAYGTNDNGCQIEGSDRIRQMAIQTMEICCPTTCESYYDNMQYEPVTPEKNLEGPAEVPAELPGLPMPESAEQTQSTSLEVPEPIQPSSEQASAVRQVSHSAPSRQIAAKGTIRAIETAGGSATVRVDRNILIPAGTRMTIHHRHQLGRISTLGEVEVWQSEPGQVSVRPIGLLSIKRLAINDLAILYGRSTSSIRAS